MRREREPVVIGNWKMNPATVDDAVTLARAIGGIAGGGVHLGVAPPAIALAAVARGLRGTKVDVFAQDVHWQEKGAFTGQVAASMLLGIAVGSIVGHSEVRRDLGDDDARVARKVARAVAAGLRVVLCVGESEAQFLANETKAVVARQVALDLMAVPQDAAITIAYEPIWAIGTGRAATAEHAAAAAAAIRRALTAAGRAGQTTPILYGGSVTAENASEFASVDEIDGALVGGASLSPDQFAVIVASFAA